MQPIASGPTARTKVLTAAIDKRSQRIEAYAMRRRTTAPMTKGFRIMGNRKVMVAVNQ